METAVIVLFVIGTLVNLLKGADLLLRPYQKRWIQAKAERLTLWAEYTRPIEWSAKLYAAKGEFVLNAFIKVTPLIVLVLLLIAMIFAPNKQEVTILMLFVIYSYTTMLLIGQSIFKGATRVFEGGKFKSFLKTKTLLVLTIIGWLLLILVLWIAENYSGRTHTLSSFVDLASALVFGAISLPLSLLIFNLFIAVIISLVLDCLLATLEFGLKLLRAVAWRIVEYDKGAYAALVLIVTVILGVVLGIINMK